MNQLEKDMWDYTERRPGTTYGDMAAADDRQSRELERSISGMGKKRRVAPGRQPTRKKQSSGFATFLKILVLIFAVAIFFGDNDDTVDPLSSLTFDAAGR